MDLLDLSEWSELGERLKQVNPGRYRKVVELLREMVAAQEILSEAPSPLRAKSRYRAKRYSA